MRDGLWAAAWICAVALAAVHPAHAQQAAPAPNLPAPSVFASPPATSKPKPPSTVIRAGPSRLTRAQRAAAERAGPPGTGKSNLACVVFEGRTGIDARSTLYNRCGTGVRLFYCLQYKNGADNCAPLTIDDSTATLWDLLAGQSLVMPATDILKRWSVFACQTPLTPWGVLFRDGNLNGDCVETGLEPPRGQPAPRPIIRSNEPSTWPAGTVNMTCLNVAPTLTRYFQMQLINRCASPVNVVICATTNVPVGAWPCATPVPDHVGPPTDPGWPVVGGLPRPSQIVRWSAFGCVDPAVPRNLRYDGARLVGDCVAPPKADTAAALPRRGASRATRRLSSETSDEELAAREQQRLAAARAIDAERARINDSANNLLGVLGTVALTTAETYAAAKAQQQSNAAAATIIQQQQQSSVAQGGYQPASPGVSASGGSQGRHEVLVEHSGSCAQVVNQVRDSDVDGMIWFNFHNSCSFPIKIWHNQIAPGSFSSLSTAPAGGNSSRSWENVKRYGRTGIVFISCPDAVNGQTVYKRDGANGGFYCYYWSS